MGKALNYYNEYDPFAAAWLRELIKDGLIPDGVVDERSITDVAPEDLKGFTQCHFFCGIGGWSRALHIAGWSPDRPVWTGSPPCQPFSSAGNQKGKDDLRHLWPVFFNLIRECKPPTIFGEQVASAIRFGWLDDLQTDLEAEGYAAAAVVLPSGGIGAPHKRERLFFVADSLSQGLQGHGRSGQEQVSQERQGEERHGAEGGLWHSSVGDSEHTGSHGAEIGRSATEASDRGEEGQDFSCESKGTGRSKIAGDIRFWDNSTTIYCRDGKNRPIPTEPALFPLAHGLPNRVGILRGAGNAIVPQAAAEIIKAYMEQDDEQN
ncbi:DNA cytosine methyltransferase [bacterium]|nr:DNA cytosine methyltransferase [bacterium]